MLFSPLFMYLPQASTMAPFTDRIFDFILWSSVVLLVITVAVMVYFAFKYKAKPGDTGPTPYIHGNSLFEWGVSIFLSVFFLTCFFWGLVGFNRYHTFPDNALEVTVYGQQWLWQFQYGNGKTTTNELFVPKGVPVKLIMISKDVIHDFYVPNFRLKHDVVPGRYNKMWFEATQLGSHEIFCTKYCGTSHSNMIGKVTVLEPEQFKVWLRGGDFEKVNMVDVGKTLFEKRNCVACHSVDAQAKKIGPTLNGLFESMVNLTNGTAVKADENYIRTAIESPGQQVVQGYAPIMPTYKGLLKDEDIGALVAYIKSLRSH
jgi:cytochrome c oxidase subunit 2